MKRVFFCKNSDFLFVLCYNSAPVGGNYMEKLKLEDLDNEALVDLLVILQGMDDALKEEEEKMKND